MSVVAYDEPLLRHNVLGAAGFDASIVDGRFHPKGEQLSKYIVFKGFCGGMRTQEIMPVQGLRAGDQGAYI